MIPCVMEEETDKMSAPLAALVGEDLSLLGLAELETRISVLKDEIARVQSVVEGKKGSRADAEAFFQSKKG